MKDTGLGEREDRPRPSPGATAGDLSPGRGPLPSRSPSPGPPVRPRFKIVSLTGYRGVGDGHSNRKPVTTWTVLDKLNESKPVGIEHYKLDAAEAELADYEAAWEHWIATSEWVEPSTEQHRREIRYVKGGTRFRPWCGACKAKSPAGSTHCATCGGSLY